MIEEQGQTQWLALAWLAIGSDAHLVIVKQLGLVGQSGSLFPRLLHPLFQHVFVVLLLFTNNSVGFAPWHVKKSVYLRLGL